MSLASQSAIAFRCSCKSTILKKNCVLLNLCAASPAKMSSSKDNWKYRCLKREISKLMFNLSKIKLDGITEGSEEAVNVDQQLKLIIDEIKEFQEIIDHSIVKDLSQRGVTFTEYKPGRRPASASASAAQGSVIDKQPTSYSFGIRKDPPQRSLVDKGLAAHGSRAQGDQAGESSASAKDEEAYQLCKKYYDDYLKVYTEIEYEDTECRIVFVQFFTDVRRVPEEFSIRLEHHLGSGRYELLNIRPEHFEKKVEGILKEVHELPDILDALRREFGTVDPKQE